MAGIVENRHVRADEVRADRVLQILDGCLLDVVEEQDVEIELGQGVGDELGVVARDSSAAQTVFAVADDDRRAPFCMGFACRKQVQRSQKRQKENEGSVLAKRRAC